MLLGERIKLFQFKLLTRIFFVLVVIANIVGVAFTNTFFIAFADEFY